MRLPKLPDFLAGIPVVYFCRTPARTYKQSMVENVIFDVKSLDDLFNKAKQRGLPKLDSSEQQSQSSSS